MAHQWDHSHTNMIGMRGPHPPQSKQQEMRTASKQATTTTTRKHVKERFSRMVSRMNAYRQVHGA